MCSKLATSQTTLISLKVCLTYQTVNRPSTSTQQSVLYSLKVTAADLKLSGAEYRSVSSTAQRLSHAVGHMHIIPEKPESTRHHSSSCYVKKTEQVISCRTNS